MTISYSKPRRTAAREEFLAFALPDIDGTELDEVQEVLKNGWLTTGPKTHLFEAEFAEYVGAKHAIAVNSCTAAMHLALEAIGLQPGDFVVTTPYTFAATAEVIHYFQATPVFVDVDPETLNIDPKRLEETLKDLETSLGKGLLPRATAAGRVIGHGLPKLNGKGASPGRVKAIIPVHYAGLPAEMDAIEAIARERNLAIIEDAAHAFPAKYKDAWIGQDTGVANGTRFSCFSFYATKTITTGEGGMICTSDDALAGRCRVMALHGISKDAWKRYAAEGNWYYEIIAPGYKYNMTDIAAAIGLAQLRKADSMWRRRREIAHRYNQAFGSLSELETPSDRSDCQHAWHLYPLRLNLEHLPLDRSEFIQELKDLNIGTSVHFIPLHLHPYYQQTYNYRPTDFPIAFDEYKRAISLPIYSKMSDQDVEDVIRAVSRVVNQ
ncbi:MAG: DegT/DnrJ/EryC1/StrS aminotransferase family protein [Anaerolineaceae bacterium]|nr:MAG: DegT/DnrJ/EryC1/StrS aminotransferase family protein [Anaerolineaceae bacterium]